MNIAKSLVTCKEIVIPEEILGSGNFIPHQWYHIITTKFITSKGETRPDNNAITILSEIIYWYRLQSGNFNRFEQQELNIHFIGDAWQTSYEHFERKFNYNRQRVRRALIRLEELNLVRREFHIVSLKGQKYHNVLALRLNIEQLKIYCIEYLNNTILNSDKDTSLKNFSKGRSNKLAANNNVACCLQNDTPSLQKLNIYKINKENNNKNLDISYASDFFKNENEIFSEQNKLKFSEKTKSVLKGQKASNYSEFTDEELEQIKVLSGREYSLQAIKKIREKINWKIKKLFPSRYHLIQYCISFTAKEITPEDTLNREDYNFTRNDEISKKQQRQEAYLEEIEESKEISKPAQLRRKVAAIFERDLSYKLLKTCEFKRVRDDLFLVTLDYACSLTPTQEKILSNAIKSVYGKININYQIQEKEGVTTSLNFSDAISLNNENISNYLPQSQNLSEITSEVVIADNNTSSVWEYIRNQLINYFGEEGQALDRAWFSKLTFEAKDQKLIIKASSSFIRSYVSNKFGRLIEKYSKQLNYEFNIYDSIITN